MDPFFLLGFLFGCGALWFAWLSIRDMNSGKVCDEDTQETRAIAAMLCGFFAVSFILMGIGS